MKTTKQKFKKELMQIGVLTFSEFKKMMRSSAIEMQKRIRNRREDAIVEMERAKERIKELREDIKEKQVKIKEIGEQEYIEWFNKCKKDAKADPDQEWVGGDKPKFDEEIKNGN